jgi:hypothetical protein
MRGPRGGSCGSRPSPVRDPPRQSARAGRFFVDGCGSLANARPMEGRCPRRRRPRTVLSRGSRSPQETNPSVTRRLRWAGSSGARVHAAATPASPGLAAVASVFARSAAAPTSASSAPVEAEGVAAVGSTAAWEARVHPVETRFWVRMAMRKPPCSKISFQPIAIRSCDTATVPLRAERRAPAHGLG